MWRLRVVWSGSTVVGPGLSTFYALDTSPGFPAAVRQLFESWKTNFPTGTTITVPNNGDVINPATGTLTGTWTDGTAPAPVTGTGTGVYAKGVGAQIRWKTPGIVNGRRVVGSTFLVPMVTIGFDTDGTLGPATITGITTAATTYLASVPGALVWSRPYPGDPSATPPKPSRVGTTSLINAVQVPDRASWIVSRRK